jgi:hypothetical protein
MARIDADNDEIIFDSGRRVYANNGIVGLAPDLMVSEGYDGGIDDDRWTAAERAELADMMIDLWTQYRKKKENSEPTR